MRQRIIITESELRNIIREAITEEFGVDLEDTLSWVAKKRPDLSPYAQKKFAQNIINKRKREREAMEQPKVEPRKPGVYQVFGQYDETDVECFRPAFMYFHGQLESDSYQRNTDNMDLFKISDDFKSKMNGHKGTPGVYDCEYYGKPCKLFVYIDKSIGMGRTLGLCCYADDNEALDYIMEEMR